jgi:hypothetical protein
MKGHKPWLQDAPPKKNEGVLAPVQRLKEMVEGVCRSFRTPKAVHEGGKEIDREVFGGEARQCFLQGLFPPTLHGT